MFQLKAKVIKNIEVKPKYYKICLAVSRIARVAQPGQFAAIRISDTDEPLLRRPLSIHGVSGGNIEFLYEAVGQGTQILSRKKTGEVLDIIGPLGNGFDYERRTTNDERRILVAGGMGVAPLTFLAEKLTECKIIVLLGAKTENQILCEEEFKRLGCEVKVATNNGSRGFKGKVTELLKKVLRTTNNEQRTTVFSCGPRPMLKAVKQLCAEYDIPAQISLEEHMACGIGACLGCAVKTSEGYKRACKDGPVFNADEVIF